MSGFRFPGVVWSALLVALPLLSMWFEQTFPGAVWAAPVAGLLLIGAKVIETAAAGRQPASAAGPDGVIREKPPAERTPRSLWWG